MRNLNILIFVKMRGEVRVPSDNNFVILCNPDRNQQALSVGWRCPNRGKHSTPRGGCPSGSAALASYHRQSSEPPASHPRLSAHPSPKAASPPGAGGTASVR